MKNSKQIKKDVDSLKPKQLNEKYPKAYNSWRAMKHRRNTHGAVIHKDFESFGSFLLIMGDKPSDEHTLDRINNDDKEYSPEKVRWATKKQQSNNKSDNVLLTNVEGITHTLAEWAYKTDQNPNTLRQRRARGWNDTEIISGIRDRGVALKLQPFPFESQRKWEDKWLDYALDGGELPRLEFLYKELEKQLSMWGTRLVILGSMLGDGSPEYDVYELIEHSPDSIQSELRRYYAYLKSLDKEALIDLKDKVDESMKKYQPIFKEVKEQIEYDLKYQEAFEKRPDTLTKGQFRDYYAKRKPRPKYTVNLPVNEDDKEAETEEV